MDSENKEFFLAIEDVGNGVEHRFSQSNLSKLLGLSQLETAEAEFSPPKKIEAKNKIKLAFVSAC